MASPTQSVSEKTSNGRETLLVVDDNAVERKYVSHILEAQGYKILAANGGPQALQIYKDNQGSIDLVITDLQMPDMNGVCLAKNIKILNAKAKIIFFTGAEREFRRTLVDSKITDVIPKTTDPEHFVIKVREILDRQKDRNK